jgi:hypothetical protein
MAQSQFLVQHKHEKEKKQNKTHRQYNAIWITYITSAVTPAIKKWAYVNTIWRSN